MRIVDVCAFYSPSGGGVRTYIDAKLQSAAALGHDLTVIVPSQYSGIVELAGGGRIAGIASPAIPFDRRYRYFDDSERLYRELDRWRPDHVECSSPWSSASIVARWPGRATRSLFMHSDPMAAHAYRYLSFLSPNIVDGLFSRFWSRLRTIAQAFDNVVSPSEHLTRKLRQRGIRNVSTVRLGVRDGFGPQLRDPALRRDFLASVGLGPSATLLLGAGRLSPEKRWPLVIKSVAQVATATDIGLVLIGDGPNRDRLARLAGRSQRVRLLPFISDRDRLARIMASADALVHGCESETFGLVVAEALASGIPAIVPDRGGAFEQVSIGTGIIYRAGDRRDLSRAIATFADSRSCALRPQSRPGAPSRSLDDHFRQLFDCYGAIEDSGRLARPKVMNAM